MDLVWIIYFIDVLASDGGTCLIAFVAAGGIGVWYGPIISDVCYEEEAKEMRSRTPVKTIIALSGVLFLYGWLMPSKDTAYKMLAAYGVAEIADNERVKNLGGKSLEVLEQAMDDYLKKD